MRGGLLAGFIAALTAVGGVFAVDVESFVDEFNENSVKASEKYKDTDVSVSGQIGEIGKDSSGKYYLTLVYEGDSSRIRKLHCYVKPELKDVLLNLKKGDAVSVSGRARCSSDYLTLHDCVSVAPQSASSAPKLPLYNEALKSLVTVEGRVAMGSAFVAEYKEKKYIFTNAHVIFCNRGVKFLSIDGRSLTVNSVTMLKDRDALMFGFDETDIPALKLLDDATVCQTGAAIGVYGNSQGQGVNTNIAGSILGVGPKNIEVSAQFVPGNSGSPVVSEGDGRVIGIATYVCRYVDWQTFDSRFGKKRLFGVRVDNITDENLGQFELKEFGKFCSRFSDLVASNNGGLYLDSRMADIIYFYSSPENLNPKGVQYSGAKFPRLDPDKLKDSKRLVELAKEWNSFEGRNLLPSATMKSIIKEISRPSQNFLRTDFEFVDKSAEEEIDVNKNILLKLKPKIEEFEKLASTHRKSFGKQLN